jgi:hypothetical protein
MHKNMKSVCANQTWSIFAKILDSMMAENQTTTTCQNFGHALVLVMPIFWWGKLGLKPNRP